MCSSVTSSRIMDNSCLDELSERFFNTLVILPYEAKRSNRARSGGLHLFTDQKVRFSNVEDTLGWYI